MSDEISKTTPTALPAELAAKLLSGIAESRATTVIAGGGKPFLRLLKSGEWVYGVADEEVQEGSHWAVNVMSLAHGWCCWVDGGEGQKNTLQGEVMTSMTEHKPPKPPPIGDTPYAEQRGFNLKCLDGADAGVEVVYKTASVGGMRGVDDLLVEIQKQLATDSAHPCPVLQLSSDWYDHTKWGRIYTPIFVVTGWSDMLGNQGGHHPSVAPPEPPKAAAAAKGKPKKPPVAAVADPPAATVTPLHAAAPPVEPVSTQQAHTGQRRRPASR
jgi:hypothetical protein